MSNPESEVVPIGVVYIDKNEMGNADIEDLHVLIRNIDNLMRKFKTAKERMKIVICSELVHRFNNGAK